MATNHSKLPCQDMSRYSGYNSHLGGPVLSLCSFFLKAVGLQEISSTLVRWTPM